MSPAATEATPSDFVTCRSATAFTVSVDARTGVSTGISAADRSLTVHAMLDPQTAPADLARPGHIFPLRAKAGGLRERRGHTEGAIDLMRLAGLQPAAVLVELMLPDGRMAKGDDVHAYAQREHLVVLSIADVVLALDALDEASPAVQAAMAAQAA